MPRSADASKAIDREYVQSLERGLAVIQAFGPDRPAMTMSEVAERTGMTRAATRRFLLTLQALGHVHSDGRYFSLRPQVLSLGYAYLSSLTWWQVAQPHMEAVAAKVGESCSASVLDGSEIVYVARVPTTRIMAINISIGTRLPATVTSMGRVLLAHLPPDQLAASLDGASFASRTARTITDRARLQRVLQDVAAQGYCLVDQELEDGLRSIAVPIKDRAGRVMAAMNVGSHVARASMEHMLETVLPALQDAAGRVTEGLPR